MSDNSGVESLLDRAIELHELGQRPQARQLYSEVLRLNPKHADAKNLLGVLTLQEGDFSAAAGLMSEAIELDNQTADFHSNLAEALKASGDFDRAIHSYRNAIALDAKNSLVWQNLGLLLQRTGQFLDAENAWRHAISLDPDSAECRNNLGLALQHQGNLASAAERYREALDRRPNFTAASENLTIASLLQGKVDEALAAARNLTKLNPKKTAAFVFLAAALNDTNHSHDAIDACRDALRLDPNCIAAHFNMGRAMLAMGEPKAAAIAFARAADLQPEGAAAQINLGLSRLATGEISEAVDVFERAAEIAPELPEAWLNLAVACERLGDLERATKYARKAVEIRPTFLAAISALGLLLIRSGNHDEGEKKLRRAVELNPNHTAALAMLANLLADRGDHVGAREFALRAMDSDPKDQRPFDVLLMLLLADHRSTIEASITAHRQFGERFACVAPYRDHPNTRLKTRRLRIGYVSPDFRAHSVSFFIAEVIRLHDRNDFEIFCYDCTSRPDAVTEAIRGFANHWRRVVGMNTQQLVERIRADQIDILVDLAGHTSDNRLLAFAAKPAPVQVSYLGYAATTGVPEIDYRLTDAVADPVGETESQHTEQLVRLSPPFISYSSPPTAPDVADLPALQVGYITFGSFNTSLKLNDAVLDLWARLLCAIPNSRLFLKAEGLGDPAACARIESHFLSKGVSTDRLTLLRRSPTFAEHMNLYADLDIALDPFPYNGTTTTCEALWMGVPVLSIAGRTHSSRVGVTLLEAVDLTDWIASSEDDFVDRAKNLVSDLPALRVLRASLRLRMQKSPLTDSVRITREIEKAYRDVWINFCDTAPAPVVPKDAAMHLVVEGWRFVPHSYALINQFQCLEMATRPGLRLSHRDMPGLGGKWHTAGGLFPAESERLLAAMTAPWPGEAADIVFRVFFPPNFAVEPDARHTVVFDTSEFQTIPPKWFRGIESLKEIDADRALTVVTPSHWSREGFINDGVDPERVVVIPHGVDVKAFHPIDGEERERIRQEYEIDGFCFLNIGAMTDNKGLTELVAAFAAVVQANPQCMLLLKGLDSLYKSRELVSKHMLEARIKNPDSVLKRIKYVGSSLSFEKMGKFYGAADAYVTPYHAEAFNLPVLEAIACGLPVICTQGGPTDDFTTAEFAKYIPSTRGKSLIDGVEGTVLLPDRARLIELMDEMVHDHAFRSAARLAGPKHVAMHFTWAIVVDQLLALFDRLLTPANVPNQTPTVAVKT